MIIAVIYATSAVAKRKPEKKLYNCDDHSLIHSFHLSPLDPNFVKIDTKKNDFALDCNAERITKLKPANDLAAEKQKWKNWKGQILTGVKLSNSGIYLEIK